MGDVLDMNEYRVRQRKLRRLEQDAKKASTHPGWDKRKESYDARQEAARAERSRADWAYGPEGLSGGSDVLQRKQAPGASVPAGFRKGELSILSASRAGAGKTQLQAQHAKTQVELYIEDIVDRAGKGQAWSQFRMAALQCTDMSPGAARESMQLAFPNMDPIKFEKWLDKAAEEFDEYSDILN